MSDTPSILHEAPQWLVVDKPAGWHTVRGSTAEAADGGGVVEAWLARTLPELGSLPESGLVHRLDRDTSGCLVVARTVAAHADLTRRFREGIGVRKWYLARVRSGIDESGVATFFFSSRHKGSARVTVAAKGEPQEAGRFRWRVVERDADRGDLVELELIGPGKRHQLRAGCARLGHPLVGDVLYGGATGDAVRLHAARVEIDGLVVTAPRPRWALRNDDGSPA